MTLKNILKSELIGLSVNIIESKNQSLVGVEGKIIDETKNTITIKTEKGNKTIMKNQATFVVEKEGKKIKINGNKICFRPEDRIKKTR